MFIIRLFLGGCISCCWHFRAGGNCLGTDGDKEAVAKATHQHRGQHRLMWVQRAIGKRSSTCSRMLRSSRGSDGSAVQQYNTKYSFRLKKYWWTGGIADKPPVNVCDQKHPLDERKIDGNQQHAVVHMGTVACTPVPEKILVL